MKTRFYPQASEVLWNDIEIIPIYEDGEGNCDVCDEGKQSFWSVYLHKVSGGVSCISDLATKEQAEDLALVLENVVKNKSKELTLWVN